MKTVILANGDFPKSPRAIQVLKTADFLIACDGAANNLLERNIVPQLVIGDLDSINAAASEKFKAVTVHVSRQDNTDLMKALEWCIQNGKKEVSILAAAGGREDHTLGNIFAITSYATELHLKLYTDTGYFVALPQFAELETHKGQQVSLFPQPLDMKITTQGLKYPLNNQALNSLYAGTLNEAEGKRIHLDFDKGVLLVYRTYEK